MCKRIPRHSGVVPKRLLPMNINLFVDFRRMRRLCPFVRQKGQKRGGFRFPPHPLKRPRRGGDWKNVLYLGMAGFVFCVLPPFVSPFSKARTQRPEKTEIARELRELILAISDRQGSKLKKRSLGGNWLVLLLCGTHLWVVSNKCVAGRPTKKPLVRSQKC